MYSKILNFIISTLIISSMLHPAAESVWLPNDIWKLVSYKGVYVRNSNDYIRWDEDGLREIQDIGDSLTTYITPNVGETDHLYNSSSGPLTSITLTENNTTVIGATVGIFAIRGEKSPSPEKTEIDGSVTKSVTVKVTSPKSKKNIPMYRMYVKCDGGVPCLRLDYQADYEGETFKVKFGEENYVYVAEFNYNSTWNNADALDDERDRASKAITTAPIEDIIDFNITDNNFSQLSTSNFDLENEDHLKSYNSAIGDNVEIYTFEDGKWKFFNSVNSNGGSNQFTSLTVGTGYWMKASSTLANNDGNFTKMGLITNSTATFDKKSYTEKSDGQTLGEGWHMLSFKDSNLRYSPTGMFVPRTITGAAVLTRLFFNTNGANIVDNNYTLNQSIDVLFNNVNNAVIRINAAVQTRNFLYNENIALRAFPAMGIDGVAGVMILSDKLFEINSTNTDIKSLSGSELNLINNEFQRTVYGDYILGFDLNDLNGSEINGTIDISIPSINTGDFRVYDLNDSNKATKLLNIFNEFNASSFNSAGDKRTSTNAFLVDFNYDITSDYSAGGTPVYNNILLTSGKRFSVEDTTYTKVFELVDVGTFKISGLSSVDITTTAFGNTVAVLCIAINAQTVNTGITCTDLGTTESKNYFAITSNQTINLDLLENNPSGTMFNDLQLDTSLPPEANTTYLKGAIVKVYTHKDILYSSNIDINESFYDGNATYNRFSSQTNVIGTLTSDLSNTMSDLRIAPAWSLDFPTNGPRLDFIDKNRRMDTILSLEYSQTMQPYWVISDLTNDPDEWYGNGEYAADSNVYNNDSQSLLRLSEDKAYWVKLSRQTNSPLRIDGNANNLRTAYSYHFNSDIENINNPISTTTNNIDHTLYIKFVDGSSGNILTSDYYDVSAKIKGKEYRLRKMGNAFQLRVNNNYLAIEPEDKDIPIFISAYDSLGRKIVEEGTNHAFSLKYEKPLYPRLSWALNGELVIDGKKTTNEYFFYEGFISDTQKGRIDHFLEKNESNLASFTDLIGWEKAEGTADDGELRVIRAVAKKGSVYSDSLSILYAPLKFGHVIELNTSETTKSKPYSFLSSKYISPDSGVQISRLKKATDDNKSVKLVYFPDGGKRYEGKRQLSSFSGTFTMFLKIDSNDNYPVATMTYLQSYAGEKFYISYDGKLYQGEFATDDRFNNDSSSYPLIGGVKKDLSGVLSGTTYLLTAHGYEIDFGNSTGVQSISRMASATEKKNSQPIYIPGIWDEYIASRVIFIDNKERLIQLGACYKDDTTCIDASPFKPVGGTDGGTGGNTGGTGGGTGGNTGGNTGGTGGGTGNLPNT